jgi:DNA-binding MarR family transcriptional regulator
MEEAGWIERRPSLDDRRGTDASLTDLGLGMVEGASGSHLELVQRVVFETLGPERAGATAEALDDIGRIARSET